MTIRCLAKKAPLPTLWLDSWVGMKLVKAVNGELRGEEAVQLLTLKEVVVRLTRDKRLLCVEGDQDEEYGQERLADETSAEFARLTLGIQLDHRQAIKDKQVFLAMNAFVVKRDKISVPWMTFFRRDPRDDLAQAKEMGIFFRFGPTPFAGNIRTSRHGLTSEFEKWRLELRSKGQSYDQQMRAELASDANVVIRNLTDWLVKKRAGRLTADDLLAMSGQGLYLHHWERIGGRPRGTKGLVKFFLSEQHAAMPASRIPAQLWADILTGNEKVLPGDPGDVELLTQVLPVAHFVLTDRRARRRILRLGIDREWNTKIYSTRELPELMEALRLLEKP